MRCHASTSRPCLCLTAIQRSSSIQILERPPNFWSFFLTLFTEVIWYSDAFCWDGVESVSDGIFTKPSPSHAWFPGKYRISAFLFVISSTPSYYRIREIIVAIIWILNLNTLYLRSAVRGSFYFNDGVPLIIYMIHATQPQRLRVLSELLSFQELLSVYILLCLLWCIQCHLWIILWHQILREVHKNHSNRLCADCGAPGKWGKKKEI